jgi:hypothetical protein
MMKDQRINPNFFCSEPYLYHSGADIHITSDWVWVEAEGKCLFPPVMRGEGIKVIPVDYIWSDFGGGGIDLSEWGKEFLDWEYIYDPLRFYDLSGGCWRSFRKNHLKWSKINDWAYVDILPQAEGDHLKLLGVWLEKRQDCVEDAELIVKFLTEPYDGVYMKAVYKGNDIVGINVWDENYMFINYRFCIVHPDEEYLDEFMRWLFYTNMGVKPVNDGGVLGNSGLERFKDKLNPIQRRAVFSYK